MLVKANENIPVSLEEKKLRVKEAAYHYGRFLESLGFDYSQKGFSTDIFLRLKDKQGNTSIKEVSLKKDKNINFLNSGTGKFEEWYGKNKLPEDINIKTFQTKQLSSLKKHMTPENIKKVKKKDQEESEAQMYAKAVQPSRETKKKDVVSEEIQRMKQMASYNKKTQ